MRTAGAVSFQVGDGRADLGAQVHRDIRQSQGVRCVDDTHRAAKGRVCAERGRELGDLGGQAVVGIRGDDHSVAAGDIAATRMARSLASDPLQV